MSASKEMVEVEENLKKLGYEVVLPDFTYEYAKIKFSDKIHTESARNKIKYGLIHGHYEKIKEGDAVLIVNVDKNGIEGCVGGNSFLEMGFAYILNKPIYLLYNIPEMGYTDEIKAMNPIVLCGDCSQINTEI